MNADELSTDLVHSGTGPVSVAAVVRPSAARQFLHNRVAMAASIVLLIIVLGVLFANLLAPFAPEEQDLAAGFQLPSLTHPLGTGNLGKDVLSRLMFGGRVTLVATVIAVGVFLLVGVLFGMVAGYRGGWFDQLVLKGADIAFAIPSFIMLLVVLAIFPGAENLAMAVWGLLASPGLARVVRSVTLGVKRELFVRAAVSSGLRTPVIILRHIWPVVVGTVVVQASTFAAGAVLTETGLGFLGLGTQGASWGNMVGEASQYIGSDPWLLVPTGSLIVIFVISLNLVGDGIRDSLAEVQQGVTRSGRGKRRRTAPMSARPASPSAVDTVPTDRTDVLLAVRGLSVALDYDGEVTEVISNVSFEIARGETVGLVGESGCGKSITASSILGLLPAGGRITTGTVTFEGVDLASQGPSAMREIRGNRIGWISQDPISSLDPAFTAGSQVAEAIRAHRKCSRAEAKSRVLELFGRVQLRDPERVYQSFPHQLSGGMAQRVGIAAAIACDPVLVIADEPTTALDVTVQAEILDVLRRLQEGGTAVFLITHDWGVLADSCDRAVVMYAGQVVEEATVLELVTQPAHPYTAALLRSDPHNAVVGQPLATLEGRVPPPNALPVGCRFQNRCPLVQPGCRAGSIPLAAVSQDRVSRCRRTDTVLQIERAS